MGHGVEQSSCCHAQQAVGILPRILSGPGGPCMPSTKSMHHCVPVISMCVPLLPMRRLAVALLD